MNPFGTRARADELQLLLDGGAAAVGPMASYAFVAERLRTAGAALAPASAPRAEFRAALRTRLVAVATVQAANAETTAAPAARPRALDAAVSWAQTRRGARAMGVTAGAMASVVAVAGIAVAGSQSLPGDPFYGVKKGTEALELRTAGNDVSKGSKHLEFAAERLKEVRGLTLGRDAALGPIAPGRPSAASAFGGSLTERVRDTLAAMDDETRAGSELLTGAYRDEHDDQALQILSDFAGRQSADLRELIPALPASTRPAAEESLALVSAVAVETSQLQAVGVCTGDCNPTATAPQLPGGGPVPQPAPTATPCGCSPAPEPAATSAPEPATTPSPAATPSPQPNPSPSPTRSPAPSSPGPLPVPVPTSSPLPVPLPTSTPLPLPLPSISPTPVPALPLPLPVPTPSVSVPLVG